MILLAHSYYLRHDAKQFARMRPYPPLATLIAAAAVRDAGHPVALFDAMLAAGTHDFDEALRAHRPRVVGLLEDNFNYVTKMCTLQMRAATIAMIAAARAAGCRIVVNGSDATDHPQRYLDAGADAVIIGDAESAMIALADRWRDGAGAPLDDIAGLVLRDAAGEMVRTAPRAATRDLDASMPCHCRRGTC
jgi:anaerobic magnesium-protoporphyrin IX monomethyl ester cyclase